MPVRPLAGLLLALICAVFTPARAQDFIPPGLTADAQLWVRNLQKATPNGGTPQARRQAEQRADTAMQHQDFATAASALEARIGLGEPTFEDFINLALAYDKRTPKAPQLVLFAARQALALADDGQSAGAMVLMAEALRGMGRDVQALAVLEALVQRDDSKPLYSKMLAEARQAAGFQLRRIRTEADAEPARACLSFTLPPTRRSDFQPQDWVRLDPPLPDAAVTLEGNEICVSGLPSASTTRLTLRAGLPGEQGLALKADATVAVAMPRRAPRIDFDTRMFVLPKGQTPAIMLSTVNVSAVSLQLVRLTERNVSALLRQAKLGEAVEMWTARELADDYGRVVWTGSAEVPGWQANRVLRTALPVPEAINSAGPGLYALIATPGDGGKSGASVQIIVHTDLAPTVWRGSDGLTVQLRGYADARPKPGVRLDLLAHNNDVLAQATTDADGVARFAVPLLRGQGPLAPAALHAFGAGEDFAALDLTSAAFDLSDRGVEGAPHPGPVDAYVWTDRGIYRAGETVQVMALLRDAAGAPLDLAARVTIRRPNGQVFSETAPPRIGGAAINLPVTLSSGAASGSWAVELRTEPDGPPVGRATFKVDSFTPERLAVDAGALPGFLAVGTAETVEITARYLYGAPAAHMSTTATLRLVPDLAPFPALAGWKVGLANETYVPVERAIAMPATDADGRTQLPLVLGRLPDVTVPLKAALSVAVTDPAGRAVATQLEIPVRSDSRMIGLKPLFADNAVDAKAEARLDVAAFALDGGRTAMQARLRLVRERPDWRLVSRNGQARYETVWKDEPLETAEVSIPAGEALHLARRLDFGRYRIELAEIGGMAATSYRFRAGWATSDSPDVPDRVDVSADRKLVAAGETVTLHIVPPFAGEASVLVLSDRVHSLRNLHLPAEGADVEVPVGQDWGPGAYVAVHVFRPGAATARPGRAIGLVWVGIDPAARRLAATVEAPARAAPRGRTEIAVRTAPGAWVSLAAVDEGILRLTHYASPDPGPHFLGRRMLGLDIRDDWGRLIAPPDAPATVLRQGGDEFGGLPRDDPDRILSRFFPPVQAGADGVARFGLEIGDFAGEVRLMAVVWAERRVGAASQAMLVRDPLVADALLPRYLAPGDEARLAVLLHNLDLPDGAVAARLSVTGPLELTGPERLSVTLAKGAQALPLSGLRATGTGTGMVRLEVAGPDGFQAVHSYRLVIHSTRGTTTQLAGAELAPGAEVALAPDLARFIPGTATATASLGGRVRYDAAALLRALEDYSFTCLEQVTSRGLPLTWLGDGLAGADRAARLQRAVAAVLDHQRYDGSFGLWRANDEAAPWLTAYATEFLLRVRQSGGFVPPVGLAAALKNIGEEAANQSGEEAEQVSAQAYRLYVLALAGQGRPGAARILAERPEKLPSPLARAQVAAALALAHDAPRAEALFRAALDAPMRKDWAADYGSAVRDQLAITVLLAESGLLPERLAGLVAKLPGADLRPESTTTQEQAWAVAAAAVLGRGLAPVQATLDGARLASAPTISVPLPGPARLRNQGAAPLWHSVAVTGVPVAAPPAAHNGLQIRRRFFSLTGAPLEVATLRQNDSFVLLLEARAEDAQDHLLALTQGLPAGWEVAGRFGEGAQDGLDWLGALSHPDIQPAAEDRFVAVGALGKETRELRVAVRLRATAVGNFELPGAEVVDMYRPALLARLAAGRAAIGAP